MPNFTKSSLDKLNTCHPDLIKLFKEVIKTYDCCIVCGVRGKVDQDKAFAEKKSKVKYPNSKHNKIPSMAVDVVPLIDKKISWSKKDVDFFAKNVLIVARILNIKITWGGNFKGFYDGVHFEL